MKGPTRFAGVIWFGMTLGLAVVYVYAMFFMGR